MPEVDGVVAVALLLLWVYCIFDVVASDSTLIRARVSGPRLVSWVARVSKVRGQWAAAWRR